MSMDGAAELMSLLQDGGFQPEEVAQWQVQTEQQLRDGGFSEAEISEHFGEPEADPDVFRRAAEEAVGAAGGEGLRLIDNPSPIEAFAAGFEQSALGLTIGRPETAISTAPAVGAPSELGALETATRLMDKVFAAAGGFAGDFPFMVPGFIGGGAAGAAVSGPLAPAGFVAGGAAGAFALPATIRQVMIDEYEEGTLDSFPEFWERYTAALIEGAKGAALGTAVAVTGGTLAAAGVPTVGVIAAEVAVLTKLGAQLEGHAPTVDDFLVAATMIGGLRALPPTIRGVKAATVRADPHLRAMTSKLQRVYARTGKNPLQVVDDARLDPSIAEDVASTNRGIPQAYMELARQGETDPVLGAAAKAVVEKQDASPRRVQDSARVTRAEAELVLDELEAAGIVGQRPPREAAAVQPVLVTDPIEAQALMLQHRGVAPKPEPTPKTPDLVKLESEITEADARLVKVQKATAKQLRENGELGADAGPSTKKALVEKLETEQADRQTRRDALEAERAEGGPPPPAEPQPPAEPPAPPPGSREAALQTVLERVDQETPGLVSRLRDRFKKFTFEQLYTGIVDELHPLNKAIRSAAEANRNRGLDEIDRLRNERALLLGEEPPPPIERGRTRKERREARVNPVRIVDDAYKKARLFKGHVGKATHMLEFGMLRFSDKSVIGPGLRQILEPVKQDLDTVRGYLVSARALELAARDKPIETGVDLVAARRVVDGFRREMAPIAEQLRVFQEAQLAYLKDAGLISPEAFVVMLEANREFVPFYRVFEEGEARAGGGARVQRGDPFNPIFRMTGSERKIHDPFESIIKNTYLYVELAEKADVFNTLIRFVENTPGSELAHRVSARSRPVRLSEREVVSIVRKLRDGGDMTAAEKARLSEEFNIFRPEGLRPQRNQIVRFEKGKREIWELDPEIADALNAMNVESVGMITKFLRVPARALRAGAILSPEFIARNPIRDTLIAFIQSDAPFTLALDSLWGVAAVTGKTKIYQDWIRSGGPMAELVAMDRLYLQKNLHEVMGQTGLMQKTRNVILAPYEMLRLFSQTAEQATRVAVFGRTTRPGRTAALRETIREIRARSTGKEFAAPILTEEQLLRGGLNSREASLDFGRRGAYTQALNMVDAFFNANVQGVDKMIRTMRDNPARTHTRALIGITLPSVILRVLNEGEEGFEGIPKWQKDLFWVFPTRDDQGRQAWHRIPKPFQMGMLYGTLAERAVEAIIREDPGAFDDFIASFMNGSMPSLWPNAFVPIVEHFANESMFTERPIIPWDREGAFPEVQRTVYTSELTKAIGRWLGEALPFNLDERPGSLAAPAVLDNYLRAWTGGLGQHIHTALDFALRSAGVLPPNNAPARTWADTPFIKAFEIRYPSMGSEHVIQFFDNWEKLRAVEKTEQALARDLQPRRQFEFQNEYAPWQTDLQSMRDAISDHMKQMRMIDIIPLEMQSADEKRELIDKYMVNIVTTAQAANTIMERQLGEDRPKGRLQVLLEEREAR